MALSTLTKKALDVMLASKPAGFELFTAINANNASTLSTDTRQRLVLAMGQAAAAEFIASITATTPLATTNASNNLARALCSQPALSDINAML